ncbi:amidase [Penicillium subrubescens]|uniref:amidase n=1 Tax=Penicillium subrubescens TaxID=1316194 RepID=UPI0025459916|nr:amidase [Penicillium subrubescens]KAJ5891240.1 amidase [Penicillium subrubescens]
MEISGAREQQQDWCILDASIDELLDALSKGCLTSVELVARYLRRLGTYDASGPKLSAVPILNSSVMEDAAISDSRRATGLPPRALEGIPFLVKDNIKVQGMTVAAGSPAFEHLIATDDAACVKALKSAGAIVLGRTNMPAMANGGMQRGIYGRAESPYNSDFLTAAYGSGSSNGSATAIAANFAAFSLGTETVSSGRSPASNNALVAYTPSRGLLPLTGVWPLYPTCDVLVPYTRTMRDMLLILEVLVGAGNDVLGDFWRQQPFIPLPTVSQIRPPSFQELKNEHSLQGKRLGIPSMYIGGASPVPISTRPSVLKLWRESRQALESCGAVVVEVDFPLVTHYEDCDASTDQWARIDNMPKGWLHTERHELIAHAWDDFLATNGQADCNSLSCVKPDSIFPLAPGSLPGESEADNQLDWTGLVNYPKNKSSSMFQLPGMKKGLKSLEEARRHTLENWMNSLGLDAVVFPANGDVGPSDADINNEASRLAWRNGVLYSNGNLAIRHLGVPTISVPMGTMEDTKMPVNITFAGRAYDDNRLLEFGYAFEAATQHRQMPPLVPALDSDMVSNKIIVTGPSDIQRATVRALPRIKLIAKHKRIDGSTVHLRVEGVVTDPTGIPTAKNLTCYIDGEAQSVTIDGQKWGINLTRSLSDRESAWARWTSPALVQTVIVMTYRGATGIAAGKLIIL